MSKGKPKTQLSQRYHFLSIARFFLACRAKGPNHKDHQTGREKKAQAHATRALALPRPNPRSMQSCNPISHPRQNRPEPTATKLW